MTDTADERDPLTPETFSFFDVVSGVEYPTDIVEVYSNEKAAYDLNRKLIEIANAGEDEDTTELVNEAARLFELKEDSIYEFHIKGTSDDEIFEMREQAEERFKSLKRNFKAADGTMIQKLPEEEQVNYARFMSALNLSLHVERVVRRSNGAVLEDPNADEMAQFLDKFPTSQKEKLNRAVANLRVSSSEFEAKVDADFLAKP